MKPMISVVIPSYCHDRYICAAIDSVLNQTWAHLELVVIDDGSRDRSPQILRKYRDIRMRLILQENAGAHAAINRGMREAKGDYIAILNSDDIFARTRLETLYDAMQQACADMACSYIQQINGDGAPGSIKLGWEDNLPYWLDDGDDWAPFSGEHAFTKNLYASNFISTTSNLLFSRRLLERVGEMRDLRFAHDWDFALRVATQAESVMVEEPLLSYRTHGANTISSNRDWMRFEIAWIMAVHFHGYAEKIGDRLDFRTLTSLDRETQRRYGFFGGETTLVQELLAYFDQHGREEGSTALLESASLRETFYPYLAARK